MFRYWIVFTLLFLCKSAVAVEVTDLFTAKVALNSQTQKDQNSALKAALEAVLVKVSGDDAILSNEFIRSETPSYAKYLTQFNYINDNGETHLVASFDETRITQLFFQQNIPLWGRLRPLVLFWIVVEDGYSRHVISETDESPLHDEISKIAEQRGLPVVLPLMDLTDNQNVEIPDLWGRFIDPIKLASERYAPESIVIIRVSKNRNSYSLEDVTPECDMECLQASVTIDWHITMTQSNKVVTGDIYQGLDELALIKNAMSDITSFISKKYALTTESDHELIIDVANIDSLAKYVEVSEFLEKLSAISSVKLIKAEGNNRRFLLTLMGTPESIFASLQLNNKLKQYIDPLIGQRINEVPVFYWGNE
ncbi:DUF2066 domain-containing protein [Pseudocolwellia agarivorans]|jgi:hypothetical protein|uniref:DUF2066 domain-containing protein n=1 Tax=Pseudocolwellia agarivorans TaxID=1911682 RepID=UPI003F884F36